MPTGVYDDEETEKKPALGGADDGKETLSEPEEKKFGEIAENYDSSPAEEIAEKENSLANSEQESLDDAKNQEPPSYYNASASKEKPSVTSSARGIIGNLKNKKVLGGLLGGAAFIILILFLMSALKIPNYAANIATYRFARSAMEYARTSSEIDGAKLSVDAADDAKYNSLKDKYTKLRSATWGKLDQYRPEKVYENLKTNGTITYETTTEKKLGIETRKKITAVVINGERIPVDSPSFKQKFGNPIQTYKDRVALGNKIEARVSEALKGSNTLVRSSVAKKLRTDLGIKLRFWEKGAKNYQGLSADDADKTLLKESNERITTKPNGSAVTQTINEATESVDEAITDCIDETPCAKELEKGNTPDKVSKALTEGVTEGFGKQILGTISGTYAIAAPACMIYDGSINHASDTIDAQTASTIKSYDTLSTQKDQQLMGDANAAALGALNRKYSAGDSVPDQYLSGRTVDTSVEKSPQASVMGDFTLLNVLLSNQQMADALNTIVDPVCRGLASWQGAVATTVVGAAIAVLSGGSSAAAEGAATQGIRAVVAQILEKGFLKKAITASLEKVTTIEGRQELKGFSKKFARDLAGIEAGTALAKLLVLSRSGLVNNGAFSAGADAINQADMGAVAENNIYMQKMMYGAPMTNATVAVVDTNANKLLAEKESLSPGLGKYFAITSPLSKLKNRSYTMVASMKTKGLVSLLGALSPQSIMQLVLPATKANAATAADSNWGIIQWGWSPEETALIESNESYGVLENEEYLSDADKTNISGTYGSCFTATWGELLRDGKIHRTEDGDVISDDALCSPQSLGPHNPTLGDKVFRWRLFMKRNAVLEQNLGIQNPDDDTSTTTQCTDSQSSNKNLFMVGDSLSDGMVSAGIESKLKAAGWNPTIIHKQGQSMSWGIQQIQDNQDTVAAAGVIVVELGTNGGVDKLDDLYSAIRNINSTAKVYWVNYISAKDPGTYQSWSAKLQDFATANSITVINWASIGGEYITADTSLGIHPANYGPFADLVVSTIQSSPGCSSTSATGWVWPIKKEDLDNWSSIKSSESAGAGLNQCWMHYHDTNTKSGYHAAIDINITNKPVYAATSGEIVGKYDDGYNTLVIKSSTSNYYAVYEHMSSFSVKQGDSVTAGQQIGISGEVGTEGAPHLHFGITTSSARFGTYADPWATINPLDVLPNDYSPALLKDDDTGSCLTQDIKGKSGFGIPTAYKQNNGADSRYY